MLNIHWAAGHIIPKPLFVPLSETVWTAVMVLGGILDHFARIRAEARSCR